MTRRAGKAAGGIAAAVLAGAAAFIAPWEGRELSAYRDIVGVWTICYGHTGGVKAGQVATEAQCRSMLAQDVETHWRALAQCMPTLPEAPVPVQAALTSWAFNLGPRCDSTLVRKGNARDWRGACDELLKWNRAGGRVVRGLTLRREAERELCLSGL